MPRRKKRIVAKLVGGLGNQLFIYFAALNFATEYKRELVLDLSFIEQSHSSGLSRLDNFIVEGQVIETTGIRRRIRQFQEKLIDSLALQGLKFFSRNYVDEESVEKFATRRESKNLYLRSFHNTTRHYEVVGRPKLKLQYASNQFTQLQKEISEAVSLHLRGGDYANFSSVFGPLSTAYYLNIFSSDQHINALAKSRGIYLFSDDKSRSEILSKELIDQGFIVFTVSVLYGLNPAEELLLISSAKVIIVANSTFSFWASEMSDSNSLIVAPSDYTRTGIKVDFDTSRNRLLKTSEWE